MNKPETTSRNAARFTSAIFDALHGGEHAWEDMTDEQFAEFTERVKDIVKNRPKRPVQPNSRATT